MKQRLSLATFIWLGICASLALDIPLLIYNPIAEKVIKVVCFPAAEIIAPYISLILPMEDLPRLIVSLMIANMIECVVISVLVYYGYLYLIYIKAKHEE